MFFPMRITQGVFTRYQRSTMTLRAAIRLVRPLGPCGCVVDQHHRVVWPTPTLTPTLH